MAQLFQTLEVEVVQSGGAITFRKRLQGGLAVAGFTGIGAGLCYAVGRYIARQPDPLGPIGWFLKGGAGLLGVLAAVCLLGTFALALVPGWRNYCIVDSLVRSVRFRGRNIPFAEIRSFDVAPFRGRFMAIMARVANGEPLLLMTAAASQRASLELLARTLTESIGSQPSGPLQPEAAADPFGPSFRATVALAMGVLWVVGGYFFFPGLSFVSAIDPKETLRIPVWSAGFAIIAFGLFILVKARRSRHFR